MKEKYLLKHFDTPLILLSMYRDSEGFHATILQIIEANKRFLPLDLTLTDEGLTSWLKQRTIPANRAYVVNFLANLGLSEKDTMGIIKISKGLSLNDCYWVVEEDFPGTFAENNLYDNRFSRILSYMAFTGHGTTQRTTFISSPEFTTNGMLAKGWRRIQGKVYLYKSGTVGFSNAGNEPYCEYYASQVGKRMGLDIVSYGLAKWKGRLCSTCELFTSKKLSYIPIGRLVKKGGINAVIDFYKNLGSKFMDSLTDMIVFDSLILNTDRHLGNFGVLVDNETNRIIRPAPLFDHGLSLLTYLPEDELDGWMKYSKTRFPAAYPDFDNFAKSLMTDRQRKMLRALVDFHFENLSKYRWSKKRIKTIEELIHKRAALLLS